MRKARTKMMLFMVVTLLGLAGAPAGAIEAPPAALTPAVVLDAELNLTSGWMRLGALGRIVRNQTGAYIACHDRAGNMFVPVLKPGKQQLRDVLAAITAAVPLTTEIMVDRDRVVICFWEKPDAPILAEMLKLARSDDELERATGARWLEQVGGRDALVQLVKMLADPSERVRYFAARSVALGWPSSDGNDVISGAAACVAQPGTALAVARAIDTGTWRATRLYMYRIASSLHDPAVLPALKRRMEKIRSNNTYYRYTSQKLCPVIADIGGPEAEAILLAAVDRLPSKHAPYAQQALGRLGTDAAIEWLNAQIDILMKKEKRPSFAYLASLIASSGNPAAIPVLMRIRELSRKQKHPQDEESVFVQLLARFDTPEAQALRLEVLFRPRPAAPAPAPEHPFGFGVGHGAPTRGISSVHYSQAHHMVSVPGIRKRLIAELDKGGAVARAAALALAPTRDPLLAPKLVQVLLETENTRQASDEDRTVAALKSLGGPEAEKALIERGNITAVGGAASPKTREMIRGMLLAGRSSAHNAPDYRARAAWALAARPDPADLDALLASARMDGGRGTMNATWSAIAAIGGKRAAQELLAAAAKDSLAAGRALAASRDPHCIAALRDALTGDDPKRKGLQLTRLVTYYEVRLGAYYIVTAAMADLPAADDDTKEALIALLAQTRDPRGTDAITRLLGDAEQSVAVRRSAVEELCGAKGMNLNRADPGAFEPMLRAHAHDADKQVQWTAKQAIETYWGVKNLRKPPPPRNPRDPRDPVDPGDEREFPPPPDAG